MSAIWGIVPVSSTEKTEEALHTMRTSYAPFAIDRYSSLSLDTGVSFHCGLQFFTEESFQEVLPFYDNTKGVLFTADVVLDNREELLSQFPLLSGDTTDSGLLLAALEKWGSSVCDHLLGAFAFAIYHTSTHTLHLYTDHMGNRSLFYAILPDRILFSTALVPLARTLSAAVSEKWLAACLATTSADMMLYEALTPYEGILQMPAAGHLTWTPEFSSLDIYWDRTSLPKPLPHKDPMHYQTLFRDTLSACVSSMLRSAEHTGCTLSSGLDSSAIAALAAPRLAEMGEQLYSYTSVPLRDFVPEGTEPADESAGVLATCRQYPNISPAFLSCPGQDAFTELSRLVPLLGYPMKSGHNLTWLDAIYEKAHRDGCRVVLKGQYGNATISWGKALSVFYQLFCSGHPRIALRTMKDFGHRYGIPRKYMLKCILTEWIGNLFPAKPEDPLTAPGLMQRYHISRAYRKQMRSAGGGEMDSREKRLSFIFNPTAQMQLGMFDTAMSLIHGVLIRDPSKDKRIIELCCSLPVECSLSGSLERGMVRTYLEGIVPDSIRKEIFHRGVQSADSTFRSQLLWDENRRDILEVLHSPTLRRYIDPGKLDPLLIRLEEASASELTFSDLRMANVLYSCSLFLKEV